MTDELQWKIENLPDSPGCYIMKSGGEVIYVGKAKNLKNRVKQYFQSSKAHTPKVQAMVSHVDDFSLVLVANELEALVLEANLIRLHKPFYNILLKDDKHYPFIALDMDTDYPVPVLRRKREKDHLRYFGPYTGTTVLYDVLDILRTEFHLRACTTNIKPGHVRRPCIHHQMGTCMAPCAGLITPEEYRELVQNAISFLEGNTGAIESQLTQKMRNAASAMQFEQAATYRDRLNAIRQLKEKQYAEGNLSRQQDVLAVQYEGEDALVQMLSVREGRLVYSDLFILEHSADEEEASVLLSFILQYYSSDNIPPAELLLSAMPEDADVLAQLLTELVPKKRAVHILVPQRGEKRKLLLLAKKNLQEAVMKRQKKLADSYNRTKGASAELAEVLQLPHVPRRIEGFDISNTQGALSVASMVVMVDGVCAHNKYRTFRIKTVQGANDFASMYEVITRRLQHGLSELQERNEKGLDPEGGSFTPLPDLILIDGGYGQLHKAQDAMHALGLDIPMFGLAERIDEICLPDRDEAILLPRSSPALHLIQRLRDEAHRFAITHHRNLRQKNTISSRLDAVPGIGPKRKQALIKAFKSVEAMREATPEMLSAVEGMTRETAQNVYTMLHADEMNTIETEKHTEE